jgi:hypothetical protein
LEKPLRKISAALVAVFAVVTLLTQPRGAERDGAPLLTGAQVPANVMAKIAGSCADCHSETTRYPWYSYVAPVSLLIKSDVERGRAHLNLSRWADYSLVRRQRSLSEIANQVKDREMPPPIYTFIHKEATLSESDAAAIFEWTQAERARLIAASQP